MLCFWDLRTGQKISGGHESNSLYNLDLKKLESKAFHTEVVDDNKMSMWHRCLGHVPLKCVRNISFLNVENKHDSILIFDACQFAKNKRSIPVPHHLVLEPNNPHW